MDDPYRLLEPFYEKLKSLKRLGVRMKDIAASLDISPSVLPSLYATVLPEFINKSQACGHSRALDEALSKVNNISRKKLLADIESMCAKASEIPVEPGRTEYNPRFVSNIIKENRSAYDRVGKLEGIYMSYSCSSSVRCLKAEPFYLVRSKDGKGLLAGRKSVHQSVKQGIAMVKRHRMLYILLNAFDEPDMSLVSVYLQLPFLEDPRVLRGLYLVPDYNNNPVARRIVFLKLSDNYSPEEFAAAQASIVPQTEMNDEQRLIYEYTCSAGDSIKMCTLPSPRLDVRDLEAEKSLLEKEDAILNRN
ncbi:MAG: hypothetical protein LIO77_05100 [Rikenellaceae bacterium]|nr:hypothetical protein [Rikenellaceae bacterium]